ncbi:purine nucleoside permease [Lentinus brumalis]|uniref:Purine nucleoside permease n=1 Tax=Lentinus brumalis TaxID=2498619 RepID=A0A371CJ40_9APHY|nr:purine nucleoside permease [Polyporus brumalis]
MTHAATRITPKVFIVSMFTAEGTAWYGLPEFNLLEQNITVPGFSPLFPQAHCTLDGSICHLVTGEGEINAASTMTALVYSPIFNLTQTYFFVAGVGGISPKRGTLGSATFARFAVHVGLQYEFDAREKPADWPTGYVPQGSYAPNQYPLTLYGTEVYELNDDLRQAVIRMAQTATLLDDPLVQEYRANYASNPTFAPGAASPSVVACDTATSDTFWTGALLAEAFENTTTLFTNGSAVYCTTQQEDNATLAVLLRGAVSGLVDFARVIVMRTGSNFDRQYDGQTAVANRFAMLSAGFALSVQNILLAGLPVVTGIVSGWDATFREGVKPSHYVGDIYASLGGTPDFGPMSAK